MYILHIGISLISKVSPIPPIPEHKKSLGTEATAGNYIASPFFPPRACKNCRLLQYIDSAAVGEKKAGGGGGFFA